MSPTRRLPRFFALRTDSRRVAAIRSPGRGPALRSLVFVLLLVWGGSVSEAREGPGGYDVKRSAYWAYAWEGPAETTGPKGLRLYDSGAGGYVLRLLVLDEERGWRLILTDTLDPRRGVDRTEIVDDISGWWVRLEHRSGVQGKSLDAYFARARELPSIDEATGFLDYRLTAAGGFSMVPRIPARGATKEAIWDGFFEQLDAAGLSQDLAANVPDGFRAPVLFLDVSLKEIGAEEAADRPRDWPGLLGLLARVLRSTLSPDDPRLVEFATPWAMRRVGPKGRGSSIVEPELLELASHFRSVENADPLAGHRVDDLTASAADP